MAIPTPAVILYDANGVAMAVQNGVAIPVSTPGLLITGTDGGTARFVRVASDGTVRVDPTGTTTQPISAASLPLPTGAATEATVSTLLADATFTGRINTLGQKAMAASTPVVLPSDQTAIPVTDDGGSLTVDGAVTANIGTTNGLALDATLTDGTQRAQITDGTTDVAVKAASTAAVATDTALVVAVSPNNTIPVSAASLPLPTGAATEATLATRLADSTFTGRINTQGQKTMAASTPVVLPSDQSAIPVTDDGGSLTVDGTVTANIGTTNGLALDATLTDGTQRSQITDGTTDVAVKAASTAAVATDPALVVAVSPNNTIPVSAVSLPLPTGAATEATLSTRLADATFTARVNTLGQKTAANSTPTVLASDQTAIPVTDDGGSLTVDGTVTADQGAAAALAGAWPVQHTDGTNTQPTGDAPARAIYEQITDGTNTAAVKAASTAAVATDPALVVAVSPNNTIPVSDAGGSLTVDTPQLPGALVGGRLDNNVGAWLGSTAPTVGQKTAVDSVPTVLASDQTAIPVTDNGGSLTVDGTVTANQGTPAALSGRWPVEHTDGTNVQPTMDAVSRAGYVRLTDGTTGPVTVKPGATPPSSSDDALVVVLSPNQQAIPVTATPANVDPGLRGGVLQLAGGSSGGLYAIRATVYNESTVNAQRSISSSSASDTAGGTGARSVLITYLDVTGAGPFTETVALNGTTPVNTVATDICYIESLIVVSAGSLGANAGTLTLFAATAGGGGTITTIGVGNAATGIGDNRTLWCQHYVQSGYTCNITGFDRGASNPSLFYLKAKSLAANSPEVIVSGLANITAQALRSFGSPVEIVGPARITAYGVPSTNGVTLSCSIDFFDQVTI